MRNSNGFLSAVVLSSLLAACNTAPSAAEHSPPASVKTAPAAPSQAELVRRGQELVQLGGCGDCHTPMKFDAQLKSPVPQRDRLLSGHPENAPEPKGAPGEGDQAVIGATFTSFRAPFGTVYAANLTPDMETGIGSWSERDFIATVRSGHHKGTGRPILPPMPWQNLAQQPDANLRAIYAYLRTIPPIKNHVPQPKVAEQAIAAIGDTYTRMRAAQH